MKTQEYEEVGAVEQVVCFPVKSMAGVPLEQAWMGWHGLEGDRRYAIVKNGNVTGFPWLTIRDMPELVKFKPRFSDPSNIRESQVLVKTPTGKEYNVEDLGLLENIQQHYSKGKVNLLHHYGGIFDTMDISLITSGSIENIGSELNSTLDNRRFRANIIIKANQGGDFPEEKWIKSLLVIGEQDDAAQIRPYRKDLRCMVVNIDPDTGEQNPAVMKQILEQRKNFLGIYGGVARPGSARIGDKVFLRKA
jgi:hypothetical protein